MENQNQAVQAAVTEDVFKSVTNRIAQFQATGELKLPDNYAPENAIKSAFLIISELKDKNGQSALAVCSKESVSKALLKMVTEGLNPLKRQGSFIIYGGQLQWQREYAGNVALAKRYGLKDITAAAIFEGDVFEFEVKNGVKTVIKHEQSLANLGSLNILGAYAICEMQNGKTFTEIMNFQQIQKSWLQGYAKGSSGAHKNFPDQMAIKTVINRACKLIINTSDDSNLMSDEFDEPITVDTVAEEVHSEIKQNANKEELGFDQPKASTPPLQTIPIENNIEEIPAAFK